MKKSKTTEEAWDFCDIVGTALLKAVPKGFDFKIKKIVHTAVVEIEFVELTEGVEE